jgi:hypothetical protein
VGNLRGDKANVGIAEEVYVVTFVSLTIDEDVTIAIRTIEDVENRVESIEAYLFLPPGESARTVVRHFPTMHT